MAAGAAVRARRRTVSVLPPTPPASDRRRLLRLRRTRRRPSCEGRAVMAAVAATAARQPGPAVGRVHVTRSYSLSPCQVTRNFSIFVTAVSSLCRSPPQETQESVPDLTGKLVARGLPGRVLRVVSAQEIKKEYCTIRVWGCVAWPNHVFVGGFGPVFNSSYLYLKVKKITKSQNANVSSAACESFAVRISKGSSMHVRSVLAICAHASWKRHLQTWEKSKTFIANA